MGYNKKLLIAVLVFMQLAVSGCDKKPLFVSYDNDNIQYDGRIDSLDGKKAMLSWAGSSVKIRFSGSGAKVLLQNRYYPSDLNVIVDDDSIFVIQSDSLKQWFTLGSNLPKGEHTVKIFKRTNNSDVYFYGFQLDKDAKLLPIKKRKRIIEYIGDSITHGSSINDTTQDRWRGLYSDNYFTYAAVTARHYDAKYYCLAQGGVGLMVGGNVNTIGDIYYRLNIRDKKKKWDFSKVQPGIVVINLFENDCGIISNHPEHPHFAEKFGNKKPGEDFIINAYIDFVNEVREHYPRAKIICSLGSMSAVKDGSPWLGYVNKAVEKINSPDVYFLLFPYKNTPGHPEVKEHKVMADTLINFIKRNKIWNEAS
ncbi:electron transporter RnfD [bacterium]|nr:electron transporter RnfD [bacterium]